jgi:predicted ATPase
VERDTLVSASSRHLDLLSERFLIEDELGRGGMGVVYRATDRQGRKVALKVMVPSHPTDLMPRFVREASIRIEHPNVVRVLDADVEKDLAYIAFELLEGRSIEAEIEAGPVRPERAVEIGLQASRGLAAIHACGIVHRDLKPANLFATSDGVVKILDFGIATAAERATRLTATGQVIGTPSYLSPEQARGRSDIDPRSDVWSLGAVLYEALTGRPPFARGSVIATLVAVIMEDLTPIAKHRPEAPRGFAEVVERMLKKAREDRFATADELGEALSKAGARTEPRAPSRSLTGTDEQRVVAVLLAHPVRDPGPLERAIEARSGVALPLAGDRLLGLFGGDALEGDEVDRALAVAFEARSRADRFAVAFGRASLERGTISGAVLDAAENALACSTSGVAVPAETARALGAPFDPTAGAVELGPADWRRFADRRFRAADSIVETSAILGREAERAQIERAMLTAFESERATAALILGPAGIGKSRLQQAARAMLRDRRPDVRCVPVAALPAWRGTSLSLFAALVREWVGPRHERIRAEVASAIPGRARAEEIATFLAELVGTSAPSNDRLSAARADAQLMRDRLRLAIIDYFDAATLREPVALFVEDLHWADPASIALLSEILDRAEDRRLFVLASARSELRETSPDFFGPGSVTIEPRGLIASEVALLIERVAKRKYPDAVVRSVTERTGGNPLFVEQIAAELALRAEDEDVIPLPVGVEAAVQSRLDHLPPSEKELLKRASIWKRPFSAFEIAHLGVAEPEALLAMLVRRELLRRSRGGVVTYRFQSSIVLDVAYRMLDAEQLRGLHGLAAELLANQVDASAEETAFHFEMGLELEIAAGWYAEAARWAAARGDSEAVLRLADRALELGLDKDRSFAVLMLESDALRFLGRRDAQALTLSLACDAARTDAERARALTEEVARLAASGHAAEAVAFADRAVECAEGTADGELLGLALGRKALALVWSGRIDEGSETLERATAIAEHGGPQLRALAATWRAQLAAATGDLGAARSACESSLALHRENGDVRRAAGAAADLADKLNRFGAYEDAVVALEGAIEGCRRVGNRVMEGYALANLGYALTRLGRSDEATKHLDDALRTANASNERRLAAATRAYRARAMLSDPSAARREAEEAAAMAESASAKGVAANALSIAAEASLRIGDASTAHLHSARAMSLRDELEGIEEDEAEIFDVHARVLDALGRSDEAGRIRSSGRTRIASVAEGIADPGWRERFLRDVAAHRALFE